MTVYLFNFQCLLNCFLCENLYNSKRILKTDARLCWIYMFQRNDGYSRLNLAKTGCFMRIIDTHATDSERASITITNYWLLSRVSMRYPSRYPLLQSDICQWEQTTDLAVCVHEHIFHERLVLNNIMRFIWSKAGRNVSISMCAYHNKGKQNNPNILKYSYKRAPHKMWEMKF
jgi:Lon protease-like protein